MPQSVPSGRAAVPGHQEIAARLPVFRSARVGLFATHADHLELAVARRTVTANHITLSVTEGAQR
ncbi:hypothetical protein GCM10010215_25950 [Streptomyces virginiae]|uniref:Uncharacterized protein n=2 Tax=Streptomyces TaxID=1883 RepID=A0A5P2DS45_STRVZ|nr:MULTISPECIES: hypothetical protein [Streptomyces]MBP2341899.1 hypothetical protein [Streptomyces virginiae]QES57992.1 hypothetical protein DEJ51_30760 [Streptomyces venezuelae]GGP99038.1 hypothetical protein GCM10010215_25950 [Streptomyces virginiae]GHI14226.1 hypothetical protein Scinn_36890 [Streptomyces virginiae]